MVSVSNTGIVESSELGALIVKLKNKGEKSASAQQKGQPLAYRTAITPPPPLPLPSRVTRCAPARLKNTKRENCRNKINKFNYKKLP